LQYNTFDFFRNFYFRRYPKVTMRSLLGKEHRLAERRQNIVNALTAVGQLSVADLSTKFDVSEVTIRQDLQALADQGLLLRTRGGALSINATPEYTYDVRQQQKSTEKARIGQAAAKMVQYGDTIFLDASTTAQAIVPHLRQIPELTVITNSLKIAINLLDMPQIQVLLPGGKLRRTSISLIGQPKYDVVDDINIQIGFFGARGIAIPEGLTDVDLDEVKMKRAVVETCRRVVGVVDSRKWGKVAAATFASPDKIDTIIADADAPAGLADELRKHGVEVVLA
jgi:DeoR/GlpR family transcriptional regulator of sugar metabolism